MRILGNACVPIPGLAHPRYIDRAADLSYLGWKNELLGTPLRHIAAL